MMSTDNNLKTEYSLGIVVVGDDDQNELRVLIPKGSPIPATGGDEFYTRIDNQKAISLRVMEGEDKDVRFDTPIGIAKVDLKKKYGKNTAIRYRMTYERNGQISLELTDEDHEVIGKSTFVRDAHTNVNSSRHDQKDLRQKALNQLACFAGLESVKQYVFDISSQIEFKKYREEKLGLVEDNCFLENLIFVGNPGTGKTSVARIIGEMYKNLGILDKGHLIEVSRADIVQGYQGQTAIRMNELVSDAIGGVLFIDEAYSLKTKSDDSFGQEAVDTLVKGIEDNHGKLVVILAGYKKEMETFMSSNTGLASRFSRTLDFSDYTTNELLDIARSVAKENHFVISEDGERAFVESISRQMLDDTFGNARTARNLVEAAMLTKARNYANGSYKEEEISILTKEDFGESDDILPEQKAKRSLDELGNLIGLANVKREIETMVAIAKYRMEEGIPDTDLPINMHMVFTGNPGTGKTTVARLFGQILHEIGILKKGQLIEVSRSDLIGRYQGHTAMKTAEICQRAYGGVLFIDEAYSLINGEMDSFGMEAISTLIKEMEDNKDKLVVIMAGYTDEMEQFLDSNSGLRSRIGEIIQFPDYDVEQLIHIFESCADKRNIRCRDEILGIVREKIIKMMDQPKFGNARDMRSLAEDIWKNMIRRVESENLKGSERNEVVTSDID